MSRKASSPETGVGVLIEARTLREVGRRLSIGLPRKFADESGLGAGDKVAVATVSGFAIVTRRENSRKLLEIVGGLQ